jgi:hypothetical protein
VEAQPGFNMFARDNGWGILSCLGIAVFSDFEAQPVEAAFQRRNSRNLVVSALHRADRRLPAADCWIHGRCFGGLL